MRERPILFSAPMVRAVLAGTKTQTRRVVKGRGWEPHHLAHHRLVQHDDPRAGLQAYFRGDDAGDWLGIGCPYGQPGDRLWVREAWAKTQPLGLPWPQTMIVYREGDNRTDYGGPWKPSIHMPRAASRITLEITGVRVERLQDISRGDAMAEGCPFPNMADGDDPRRWYADLWDQINGAGAWDKNPWVWVVEFRRTLSPT